MARYDVYRVRDSGNLLLDVQSDMVEGLLTRVVVPLVAKNDLVPVARRLNPIFSIGGTEYVMATQFIAVQPTASLGPPLTSLDAKHDQIVAALDMLFHGF